MVQTMVNFFFLYSIPKSKEIKKLSHVTLVQSILLYDTKNNYFPMIYFRTTVSWFTSINLNYKLYKPIKSITVTYNAQAHLVYVQIFITYFSGLLGIATKGINCIVFHLFYKHRIDANLSLCLLSLLFYLSSNRMP